MADEPLVLVIDDETGSRESMAIALEKAGFDHFRIYEKAERLGGTWRENTYPGLIDICVKNAIMDPWGLRYATQGIRRGLGPTPETGTRAAR